MKSITQKVKVAKPIEYEEIDLNIYVSDDGEIKSKNKSEVEKYEKEKLFEEQKEKRFDFIKKIIIDEKFSKYLLNYFYIENEGDLEFLIYYYNVNNKYKIESDMYCNNIENYRGWCSIQCDDYDDCITICIGDRLTNNIKNIVEHAKKLECILKE